MIDDILEDAGQRMGKTIEALQSAFNRIRIGRAHPSLLEGLSVEY